MKKFDKFLSFVAVICILILCFMLVSSAGSYSQSGSDQGEVYRPYVPMDYIEFQSSDGVIYTLNMNDVFRISDQYQGGGNETEVLMPLTGISDENLYVHLSLSFSYYGGVPYLRVNVPVSDLPNFGTSDGWEMTCVASDFIIDVDKISDVYLPRFQVLGMSDPSYYEFTSLSSMNYYSRSSSNNQFISDEDYQWSYSWSDDDINTPYLFRIKNLYEYHKSSNTDYVTYIKNGCFWVDRVSSTLYSDYSVTGVSVMVPYVISEDQVTIRDYINWFDLGKTNTIIQTSIVEVPGESPEVPDFTTWLTKSVASFMDFGFWGISIAGILAFIVGFKMVKALLDFFAGG